MRGRRLQLLIGAALITAPIVHATDVAIHVHRHLQSDAAPMKGSVVAESASEPDRSLTFPLPASSVSLPPGDWFLSARLPGAWSEPRLVSVHETPLVADLNTYPLTRLTARITLDVGKEPRELRAYFHRISLEDLDAPLEGNVVCDVIKGTATCQLPRGEFDLAFRIPGFASRYVWNATLASRGVFDAGVLRFVSGSTLSGHVEMPQRREARFEAVTITAKPVVIAGANDEQRHRNDAARVTVHPTRRGFFAIDLGPGEFTVQATYADLISEEMKVKVLAGREVSLRQPLRLDPQ